MSPQIAVQVERELSYPLQVYPGSTTMHVRHPTFLPLSHASTAVLILSPHIEVHTDGDPNLFTHV